MRFSEKLAKQRKLNNLSQEQLADKLNVTRQSISKWESGSSYPDMEKIIQICNILNCTLNDIMDDGVIGDNVVKSTDPIKYGFNEFMKFITKTCNMFSNMKFKDVVKCIIEMLLIVLLLSLISTAIVDIAGKILYGLFDFNTVFRYIYSVLETIIKLALFIISCIILIHTFKIRYLDYYVTIEDKNVNEQTIENPIDKTKEKIIIRDPVHSTSSFLDIMTDLVIVFIKVLLVMFSIPFIIGFVMFISGTAISMYYVPVNIIFLYAIIGLIGAAVLCYVALNFIYNFLFNNKSKLLINFILIIISFILIGVSTGLCVIQFTNFDFKPDTTFKSYVVTKNVSDDKLLNIDTSYSNDIEYVIDDKVKESILEVSCPYFANCSIDENENEIIINENLEPKKYYNYIVDSVKHNKIYTNNEYSHAKLILNSQNYEKIKANLFLPEE